MAITMEYICDLKHEKTLDMDRNVIAENLKKGDTFVIDHGDREKDELLARSLEATKIPGHTGMINMFKRVKGA